MGSLAVLAVIAGNVIALVLTAVVPRFDFRGDPNHLIAFGAIFGVANLMVRPLLRSRVVKASILTFALAHLVLNATLLTAAVTMHPGFAPRKIGVALLASLVISGVNLMFAVVLQFATTGKSSQLERSVVFAGVAAIGAYLVLRLILRTPFSQVSVDSLPWLVVFGPEDLNLGKLAVRLGFFVCLARYSALRIGASGQKEEFASGKNGDADGVSPDEHLLPDAEDEGHTR